MVELSRETMMCFYVAVSYGYVIKGGVWSCWASEHKVEGFIAALSSEAFNTQWCLAPRPFYFFFLHWSNDNKCKSGNIGIGRSNKAMFSLRSLRKGKQCKYLPVRNVNTRAFIRALMKRWPEFILHIVHLKSEEVSAVLLLYLNNTGTIQQL